MLDDEEEDEQPSVVTCCPVSAPGAGAFSAKRDETSPRSLASVIRFLFPIPRRSLKRVAARPFARLRRLRFLDALLHLLSCALPPRSGRTRLRLLVFRPPAPWHRTETKDDRHPRRFRLRRRHSLNFRNAAAHHMPLAEKTSRKTFFHSLLGLLSTIGVDRRLQRAIFMATTP